MKIQILGMGCAKCKALESNAREALAELSFDAQIEKIDSLEKIMGMGVMITPAIAFDGVVKSSGKLLSKREIKEMLLSEAK
jgi:small redox-active disulfide protein 2